MTDELLSLRLVVVCNSARDRELFRHAISAAAVPIEMVAADDIASAQDGFGDGADVLYIDGGFPAADIAGIVATARSARNPAFSVLLSGKENGTEPFETDALARKPRGLEAAKQLIERSIRVRLPSRALVVDDSAAVRGIVRKLLAGTRLPIEVSEAQEGFAALKLVRESAFDIVFMDHKMPGMSGLDTISEFEREQQRVHVVLMTELPDESLAVRARAKGAGFLKKPFYLTDINAALCPFYGLSALNPKRV